jgi:HSP20 family protein
MTEKEFDIKLTGNVLTISGERKADTRQNFRRKESWHGRFLRSFTIPETIDHDRARAEFKNGVLTIKVPRNAAQKPRAILVSVH